MKKTLATILLTSLFGSACAIADTSFVLQAGAASNNLSGYDSSTSVVVDASIQESSGVIAGIYVNTGGTNHETGTLNNLKTDVSNLGVYGGYQFENGFRLTAGADVVSADQSFVARNKGTSTDTFTKMPDENSLGFNVGAGYMFNNGVTVNYRYANNSFTNHADVRFKNESHMVTVGYKF